MTLDLRLFILNQLSSNSKIYCVFVVLALKMLKSFFSISFLKLGEGRAKSPRRWWQCPVGRRLGGTPQTPTAWTPHRTRWRTQRWPRKHTPKRQGFLFLLSVKEHLNCEYRQTHKGVCVLLEGGRRTTISRQRLNLSYFQLWVNSQAQQQESH